MKVIHFQHSITIQSSVDMIFDYLKNVHNLVHIHPLLISIKELSDEHADIKKLECVEKTKVFGFIPITKKYQQTVQIDEPNLTIILETFTSPKMYFKNTITLHQEESGETIVDEQFLIELPSILENFVMKQLRFAHEEMLQQLKLKIERNI